MADAQIAEAITRGDINNLSNDDWLYLNRTHPIALKLYAVILGVLGIKYD
jgi:hypothetical protein